MNIKMMLIAAAAAMTVAPAQAAGPIVDNVVATVQSVLASPSSTITNVIKALPVVLDSTAAGFANVSSVVAPALLGTGPIQTSTQTIVVPLPGPAFLNADLVKINGVLGANVSLSNPITVTLTTGQ